ncbi:unnamed protein product [Parascedosporium putredinis]|uniref:Glycosyltransferase family 8 protein n=1 Tax=Parascedosporium putredinis TaxID=1442378 RepID=A0A9P1H3G4_9PEZI|nr:unnamed protein product [Parascedosporium putredinis]CAI7995767.1 unnamed protein product [Parascedosporium putredinis]
MISKAEGSVSSFDGDSDEGQNLGKVWATLITRESYLSGLLTLDYSLRKSHSAYPLVAFYTDTVPGWCLNAIQARNIITRRVEHIRPSSEREHDEDPRFADTWTKLAVFSLTEYKRIVLLDSDMLVLRNMDELMELDLDEPALAARGGKASRRVYAAGHACVCNPLKKALPGRLGAGELRLHKTARKPGQGPGLGGSCDLSPLGNINSGLLVINPSEEVFSQIVEYMEEHGSRMIFPDQSVLSELFQGRWVALPYIYNALKTLRKPETHGAIWRKNRVKNVHYILAPKPWEELDENGDWTGTDESHRWWIEENRERIEVERRIEIADGF